MWHPHVTSPILSKGDTPERAACGDRGLSRLQATLLETLLLQRAMERHLLGEIRFEPSAP